MSTATDRKVSELDDRTYAALPESIRGTWSCSGDGDPWGDAMSHAFALNDLAYIIGATTDPTYRPGCGVEDDPECWPDSMYREDYAAGVITREDVERAIPVFSTLLHALELLGLSY